MKRKFFHPISKRFGVFGLVLTVLLTMVMIVANVALSRYSNTISSTLDLNKQISAGGDEATYQKARNLTQEIAGEGATLLKNQSEEMIDKILCQVATQWQRYDPGWGAGCEGLFLC